MRCLYETVQLSVLFTYFPCKLISFSFELKGNFILILFDKQHWKHSIYDKFLFILMFLRPNLLLNLQESL